MESGEWRVCYSRCYKSDAPKRHHAIKFVNFPIGTNKKSTNFPVAVAATFGKQPIPMNIRLAGLLLQEFDHELTSTRRMLERFPDEHADWKPHEKSFTLGRLASHVAELPRFIDWILNNEELDIMAVKDARPTFSSRTELLEFFEAQHKTGYEALENASNESLMQNWTFKAGERVVYSGSRYQAIRNWMANHQIHHRGQLSVYLRLLDVPIPGMYGPSADDILARQAQATAATEAN